MRRSGFWTPVVGCFFGHHKCATVYTFRILRAVADELNLGRRVSHSPATFGHDLPNHVPPGPAFFSYPNADYRYVRELAPAGIRYRGMHLIRDPRDVVVSAYFSHLKSHPTHDWPELEEFRRRIIGLDGEQGLLAEIDFLRDLPNNGERLRTLPAMAEWDYDDKRILEFRFEDFVVEPVKAFRKTLSHFGWLEKSALARRVRGQPTISAERLEEIVHEYSFQALSGREPGQEDVASHYRKGVAGDWREHFTQPVKDHFKQVFPGIVSSLGYEEDEGW